MEDRMSDNKSPVQFMADIGIEIGNFGKYPLQEIFREY
jgi:hypothetical protein